VRANQAAIAADRRLAQQLRANGYEPLGAVSHHHHFLWAAAAMQGNAAVGLDAARWLATQAARPEQPFGKGGSNDYFLALDWMAQVRFARWGQILAAPEPQWPDHASAFPRAIRHHARGMAYARTERPEEAAKELASLRKAAADPGLEDLTLKGIDDLTALLALAEASLRGEILLARRQYRPALAALRQAVELEDALESEEPPPWPVPSRQALGAALLLAGQPQQAAAVFSAGLERHPDNGWSLHGLAMSLRRSGRGVGAQAADARFAAAWKDADSGPPDTRY
jgi:tetratricopeptide (TPR) repeat protein